MPERLDFGAARDLHGEEEVRARRIVERVRQAHEPIYRKRADSADFRQAGGTDAALDYLAPLMRCRFFNESDAARAVAQELGIPIPDGALAAVSEHDEASQEEAFRQVSKALELVKAEHPALVQRVYELGSKIELTEGHEELARRLAAEAPSRQLAKTAAQIREIQTNARRASGRGPAPESTIQQRALAAMGELSLDSWRFLLMDMLAEELAVPESERWLLKGHPTLDRAMELLGKTGTATPEDIERYRPQIRVDAGTEAIARRIAERAREIAIGWTVTSGRERDPQLSAEQLASEAIDEVDKNPSSWANLCIPRAAAELLGIIETDAKAQPAALRAEQLIPGARASYDVLIYDHALRPQDAAAKIIAGMEKAPMKVPSTPPGLDSEFRQFPSAPPPFAAMTVRARHVGGHPALAADRKLRWLFITNVAAEVSADPHYKRILAMIQYGKVRAIRVEGSDTLQSRVTIPRVAAGGLLAFAKKKAIKRAYLIFEPHEGGDVIFEVHNYGPWELRAALSPLLRWYDEVM